MADEEQQQETPEQEQARRTAERLAELEQQKRGRLEAEVADLRAQRDRAREYLEGFEKALAETEARLAELGDA
jgi:hypothetical protein